MNISWNFINFKPLFTDNEKDKKIRIIALGIIHGSVKRVVREVQSIPEIS